MLCQNFHPFWGAKRELMSTLLAMQGRNIEAPSSEYLIAFSDVGGLGP
jgi:hypothetical protein